MKTAGLIVIAALFSTPAFAQSGAPHFSSVRAYFEGAGVVDTSSAGSGSSALWSGGGSMQGGVRLSKNVAVFGEFGKFQNIASPPLQQAIDTTVTTLSTNTGLDVTGSGTIASRYGIGGIRIQTDTRTRLTPYVLAGLGVIRATPSASFVYASGQLPNADPTVSAPALGTDVTSQILTAGSFVQPSTASEAMVAVGGGAQIRLARRWFADIGYRYNASMTGAMPLHSSGVLFGIGGKF